MEDVTLQLKLHVKLGRELLLGVTEIGVLLCSYVELQRIIDWMGQFG
jgi:hypothetical protein